LDHFSDLIFFLIHLGVKYVEDVFNRGLELKNKKEYDGALWELNKAMGMVKNNYNHPLREKNRGSRPYNKR